MSVMVEKAEFSNSEAALSRHSTTWLGDASVNFGAVRRLHYNPIMQGVLRNHRHL